MIEGLQLPCVLTFITDATLRQDEDVTTRNY